MEIIETFRIQYDGSTFKIPKSSVNFEHGYAVVDYEANKNSSVPNRRYKIMGVVDKDYETVLPFEECYTDIKLFDEGNIIVQFIRGKGDFEEYKEKIETHHIKMYDKVAVHVCELNVWKYEVVNDKTIKLISFYSSLYDVTSKLEISERFTSIGNFEKLREDLDERFAEARYCFPVSGKNRTLYCLINEEGNIRTPLFDQSTNTYIDTSSNEFNFEQTIEKLRREMNQEVPVSEVGKHLVKKLNKEINNGK